MHALATLLLLVMVVDLWQFRSVGQRYTWTHGKAEEHDRLAADLNLQQQINNVRDRVNRIERGELSKFEIVD